MSLLRTTRLLLVALLLSLCAAPSFARVFISVGFAPPVMPVYEQPLCPEPNLMWQPGYWAYGDDGYYWVPGAWVPAPYPGALWTPGYWAWNEGVYVWTPGYWGDHVGYYGGVNYGFGYFGIGFFGGEWRGGFFHYNRAVVHIDERYIHNAYEDRRYDRFVVARDSRVAFSGGPGGIRHQPIPEERLAERDRHVAPSSFQLQHEMAARGDRGAYFGNNGGHPSTLAVQRPMMMHNATQPPMRNAPVARPESPNRPGMMNPQPNPMRPSQPAQSLPQPSSRPGPAYPQQSRPAPQSQPYQAQPQPSSRPTPAYPQQSRPAPQSQPYQAPPQRQAPQQQTAPREQAPRPAAASPAPKPKSEKEEHK